MGQACSLDTQSTDEIRDRHNGSRDRGVAIGLRSEDAGERELLSVDRNERSGFIPRIDRRSFDLHRWISGVRIGFSDGVVLRGPLDHDPTVGKAYRFASVVI